eukprot:4674130-Prymnesium_polylepis.2
MDAVVGAYSGERRESVRRAINGALLDNIARAPSSRRRQPRRGALELRPVECLHGHARALPLSAAARLATHGLALPWRCRWARPHRGHSLAVCGHVRHRNDVRDGVLPHAAPCLEMLSTTSARRRADLGAA